MEVDFNNLQHRKYLDEFEEIKKIYLEKFGENSLDRVTLSDPLHPMIEDYIKITKTLKKSIKEDSPLKQIPVEIYDTLIF